MSSDDCLDPPPPEEARRGFLLRGRVQGVGFRWWTREIAQAHRLRGTVRNLRDGSVEIHVAGPSAAVDAFMDTIRSGPRHAQVHTVEEIPCRPVLPERFEITF